MFHTLTLRAAAVVACFAVAGLVGATPPLASAASAAIKLDPAVGPPGTATTVSGTGFEAREVVTVSLDRHRVGSAVANLRGAFVELVVTSPRIPLGDHIIAARGLTSLRSAIAHFVVRPGWSPEWRRPAVGPDTRESNAR